MERMNGRKIAHMVECRNPKCQMLFSAKKIETGEAKKVGFLYFCQDKCWREYQELRESSSREQK